MSPKKTDPRLKIISLILKDSLERAGIDLPDTVSVSTADEIIQESDLFGWGCGSSCKEGCKKACKDWCKNSQKQ
ncbi:MAG: hypothetical protein HUU08_09415 [Candidatus Brocadia sp.]|nr:hypothetical protein [Candidatus Brocadia sp.]UJS17506.1 MAG: hypothetical protein L3J17_00195 [Candidatus Jettenia sp.]